VVSLCDDEIPKFDGMSGWIFVKSDTSDGTRIWIEREIPMLRRNYLRIMMAGSITAFMIGNDPLLAQNQVQKPLKKLPVPGETFEVSGREAFLILSQKSPAKSKPWVWYAPTLPGLPGVEEKWMFDQFLAVGISIAGIDVGESFGSPTGRNQFTALFKEMTKNRGFSTKPALLARSRGGLMLYNWAAEHPENVGCIAGIYPVCDLSSWPGLEKASPAYGMTPEELKRDLKNHNPVSRLKPLADSKVPIFHIHGDVDTVVPLERNSGAVAAEYAKLGGHMILEVPKGQGHNMWRGFFESQTLVDFILKELKSSQH